MTIFLKVLSISLLFLTIEAKSRSAVSSQTKPSSELSKEDFREAKLLALKMIESPNWKKADSISKSIVVRFMGTNSPEDINDDSVFIPWIKENLHLTKFKSLEEVLSTRDEWNKANIEVNKENLRLYELMSKSSEAQFKVIWKPVMDSIKNGFIISGYANPPNQN